MSDTTTAFQTHTEAPPPQVWPTFRANNARALIRFLVDVVGFTEVVVYGAGERVDHAELAWPPGGGVMVGSVRDSGDQPSVTAPGNFSAYAVADDIDALHARVAAGGATITSPLHDTDYGSRDFAITDPEGNHWSFGSYRGAPR